MSKTDFGAFSAAFATFLLLATIYSAVVTEPMLVFAFSSKVTQQKSYVKRVAALHWRAAVLVSFALAAVGAIRYAISPQFSLVLAFVGWAMAAPLVLFLWFARRTAYITRTPHRAAIAGVGYLILMTALLRGFGRVAADYVFVPCILFAIPSVVIAQLLRLNVPLKDSVQCSLANPKAIWNNHWAYGKWASLAGLSAATTGLVYFFVLPVDGCGAYRAILNIPMPLLQTYTALGPVFISLFTPIRDRPQLARIVTRSLIVSGAASD